MTIFRAPIGSLMKNAAPKKAKRSTARANDADHLAFIRQLPCLITGKAPSEAAHIRYGSKIWGKPITGIAVKPDDKWVVPLSTEVHRDQHESGEAQWWQDRGLDPLVIASRLWEVSGDVEKGTAIVHSIRGAK